MSSPAQGAFVLKTEEAGERGAACTIGCIVAEVALDG